MVANTHGGVERLYRVFRYRIGRQVSGCSSCVDPNAAMALARQPLREIGKDLLGSYTFNAMTTWGSEEDFKHFLPRILETLHELPIQPQIVFQKLKSVSWREKWPTEEVIAIEGFVGELWERTLSSHSHPMNLTQILECAGIAGMDQKRLLDGALSQRTVHSGKHLASFICSHSNQLMEHRFEWPFWQQDSGQGVVRWLRDHLDEVEASLYESFEASPDHEPIDEWEDAIDTIALLRSLSSERGQKSENHPAT